MVINDLKETCPRCEGRGRVPGLEKLGIPQINYGGNCPACKGRGFTLTQLGEEVLEVIKPFVLDWLQQERQRGRTAHVLGREEPPEGGNA